MLAKIPIVAEYIKTSGIEVPGGYVCIVSSPWVYFYTCKVHKMLNLRPTSSQMDENSGQGPAGEDPIVIMMFLKKYIIVVQVMDKVKWVRNLL